MQRELTPQQPAVATGPYYGPLTAVYNPLEQDNNHAAPTHPALVDRGIRMALDWQHMGVGAEAQLVMGALPDDGTAVDINDIDFGHLFDFGE